MMTNGDKFLLVAFGFVTGMATACAIFTLVHGG